MEREELVKRVLAMLDLDEQAYSNIEKIDTPERLNKVLTVLKLETKRALSFLQGAKERGIFKVHWKIKGMEDLWREWARQQGIKEGHFLFEN